MPRLVRKRPLSERILSSLNPMDFLLWLSEELETRDWDSTAAGTQLGLVLNFVFLLARANSSPSTKDDVFTDDDGTGWMTFFVYLVTWVLIAFSLSNAFYTFTRTRKYRLFGADVQVKPSTPSAKRVKVESGSSPAPSPLRFLSNIVSPETAESRAHPDEATDVWELSVWDPLPVSLRLFCLFGPAHVLVYMIFLPLAPLDPRPSVTVFNTILLQVIISAPLLAFCTLFAQQAKDTAIIQKEVMHEYDTKFVHPRLHPVVRDVGTQHCEDQPKQLREFVQTGTPTTQIRRTFQTHANPFARTTETPVDPSSTPVNVMKPQMFTPPTASNRADGQKFGTLPRSSSLRNSLPAGYSTAATTTSANPSAPTSNQYFGGNMGINAHRKSPLKKATSLNDINAHEPASPRNSREMAAYEQRNWAQHGTPSKTSDSRRLPTSSTTGNLNNAYSSMARNRLTQERYPSRW